MEVVHSSGDVLKMDFLTVGGSSLTNVDSNQLTVTSVASGNLALYEVMPLCKYIIIVSPDRLVLWAEEMLHRSGEPFQVSEC